MSKLPRKRYIDKETIDEMIFRTENARNRLILELQARGGLRIGEVLKLTPLLFGQNTHLPKIPHPKAPSLLQDVPQKLH